MRVLGIIPLTVLIATASNPATIEIAAPMTILAFMATVFLSLGIAELRANPVARERHRRRTGGSMKNVVLGQVEPGDNYTGGMAYRKTEDGKIVIVKTNTITKSDLDEIYGPD